MIKKEKIRIDKIGDHCTGCGACSVICHKNAIKMLPNNQGFLKPHIIEEKCISCGKCSAICPAQNKVKRTGRISFHTYAIYQLDSKYTKKSSSGGVFYSLAKYMIENLHGVVFGAIYTKDHLVEIAKAETMKEVFPMMGSKYVYSNTKKTYQEVKEELEKKRFVLYSGLPCQIAGLYNYLGKEYENLITVEILCHGAPSQELFSKYLKYLEEYYKKPIQEIRQRDFSEKWNLFITKRIRIIFKDKQELVLSEDFDPYMSLYIREISYNTSCYHCNYTNLERNADITIGDYGGLGLKYKFSKEIKDGISLVLTNTEKGEKLIHKLSNIYIEKREIEEALLFNTCLTKPTTCPKRREEFQIDYENMTYQELFQKYFEKDIKYKLRAYGKKVIIKVIGYKRLGKIMYQNKITKRKQK